jgi:hypothetical protein
MEAAIQTKADDFRQLFSLPNLTSTRDSGHTLLRQGKS